MKRCSKCKKIKTLSAFSKATDQKSGLACSCRECRKVRSRVYRVKPKTKTQTAKRMHKYDMARAGIVRAKNLKTKYGITLSEWNTLFDQQRGCCAICGRHQSGLKRPLYTDHNHKTLKIRGLLCPKCNDGLGRFCADDGIDLLKNAINYLGGE